MAFESMEVAWRLLSWGNEGTFTFLKSKVLPYEL